ncbi:uncharacterized protein I303_106748 [Kwoniella dejecticola CBS 10117]|uniref:Protein CPL1-like domain-containing protein n=1 Tax=Kwoniella dejecticola CBS 10117 TaxID=1296121 RepID=A0A1A5ZTW9_9TREE|nr:uncharacterized protein I303_08610 [Kwoniella dejecticola CBS 10117]OBR81225.1 hypothetical protein I303_08610 [Kwoniella dejecticola CBS 10117]
MVYFATLILPLLITLPTLISSSPSPKPDPTRTDPLEVRGYETHPKCYNYETRDPHTCKCYPEYEEPQDHGHGEWYGKRAEETTAAAAAAAADIEAQNKKGGHHLEECVCPDYPNTELDDGWGSGEWKRKGGEKEHQHPKCVCKGQHQTYNPHTRKCECIKKWCPWTPPGHYKRGEKKGGHEHHGLKCRPCGPTGSAVPPGQGGGGGGYGGGYRKRSPSLHEAMQMRKDDERGVETLLGCKDHERACESNGHWRCNDVSSLLWSCGGCPGEGVDCGAIPGVSEVVCDQGRCLIESCRRGYTLINKPEIDYLTNTTCVNENDSPKHWFVNQGI